MGRFRISVTDSEYPEVVPEDMAAILRTPAAGRSPKDATALTKYFVTHPVERRRASDAVAQLETERRTIENKIPSTMVMSEMAAPRDTFVLMRGAYDKPSDKVTPAVPSFLPPMPADAPRNRLGLARWLVDPGNPLTARVTVNRYWQMYFGTGLVKTAEDFGSQGEAPSHPELLDWLATEFVRTGWDVKAMQRLIVTSATYRQASNATPALRERDPENRLIARGPRRSVYSYWKRTVPPPSLTIFDAPTREACVVRRQMSSTPLQALSLLNDEMYIETARKFAERIIKEGGGVPSQRLAWALRVATSRPAAATEVQILEQGLIRRLTQYRADAASAEKLLASGESPRDRSIDPAELAAYTTAASVILNLDEVITRQ